MASLPVSQFEALNGMAEAFAATRVLSRIAEQPEISLSDEEKERVSNCFKTVAFFRNLPSPVRDHCARNFQIVQLKAPSQTSTGVFYKAGKLSPSRSGLFVILDGQAHVQLTAPALNNSPSLSESSSESLDDSLVRAKRSPSPPRSPLDPSGRRSTTSSPPMGHARAPQNHPPPMQQRARQGRALSRNNSGDVSKRNSVASMEDPYEEVDPSILGSSAVVLRAGEAFGEEALFGIPVRSGAVIGVGSLTCINIVSSQTLEFLRHFLCRQLSPTFFLRPIWCRSALFIEPDLRCELDLLRVGFCLDGIRLLSPGMDPESVAELMRFSQLLPEVPAGQPILHEGEGIGGGVLVVLSGQVRLVKKSAGTIQVLQAGDLVLEPAPWFRGVWPCSAVTETKAELLIIPLANYFALGNVGKLRLNRRTLAELLGKDTATRTRLDNLRIAQQLCTGFEHVDELPIDRCAGLASAMELRSFAAGDVIQIGETQTCFLVSGEVNASYNDDDVHLQLQLNQVSQETTVSQHDGGETPVDVQKSGVKSDLHTMVLGWLGDMVRCSSVLLYMASCTSQTLIDDPKLCMIALEHVAEHSSLVERQLLQPQGPLDGEAGAPARRPLSPRGNRPITSFSRDGPRLPSPEPETQAVPLCVPMPNLHALLESVRESCVVVRGQPGSLLGTSRIRPELKASDQAFVAAGPVRVAVADETELENRGVLERSGRAMDRDDRVKSMLMIEGGERNVDEISWLVKMLSDVVPLSNLPPRMLQEVCKTMKVHDYPAGMAVYTSGDSANSLFVVLSGSAKSWIIPGQEMASRNGRGAHRRSVAPIGSPISPNQDRGSMAGPTASYGENSPGGSPSYLGSNLSRAPRNVEELLSTVNGPRAERSIEKLLSVGRKQRGSCIAWHGPGDCLGLADMEYGKRRSQLRTEGVGATLIEIHRGSVEGYVAMMVAGFKHGFQHCTHTLQVPRSLRFRDDVMLVESMLRCLPAMFMFRREQVAALCERAVYRHLEPGEVAFLEGDAMNAFGVVMQGSLDLYHGGDLGVREAFGLQAGAVVAKDALESATLEHECVLLKMSDHVRPAPSSAEVVEDRQESWREFHVMVDSNGDVKILSLASTSVDDNEPAVLIGNLSTDLLRMQTIGFDLGKENSRVPPPRSKGFFKRASSHKHNILRRASIGAAIGEVLSSPIAGAARAHVKPQIRLHFERGEIHAFSASAQSDLRQFLACVVRHRLKGKDHPLGQASKALESGDTFGEGSVQRVGRAQRDRAFARSQSRHGGKSEDSHSFSYSAAARDSTALLILSWNDLNTVAMQSMAREVLKISQMLGHQGMYPDVVNTTEMLSQIGSLLETRSFKPTDFLYHAGEPAGELYFILHGECSLRKPSALQQDGDFAYIVVGDHSVQPMPVKRVNRGRYQDAVTPCTACAPCVLGLHASFTKFEDELGQHLLSAQADTVVEAIVLRLADLKTVDPDVRSAFGDRMQALAVEVAKGNLAPPDAGVFPSSSISDLSRLLPHDTFGMEAKTATKTAAKSMRSKSRSKQLHAMNQPEPDAESAKWMIHGMPSGVEAQRNFAAATYLGQQSFHACVHLADNVEEAVKRLCTRCWTKYDSAMARCPACGKIPRAPVKSKLEMCDHAQQTMNRLAQETSEKVTREELQPEPKFQKEQDFQNVDTMMSGFSVQDFVSTRRESVGRMFEVELNLASVKLPKPAGPVSWAHRPPQSVAASPLLLKSISPAVGARGLHSPMVDDIRQKYGKQAIPGLSARTNDSLLETVMSSSTFGAAINSLGTPMNGSGTPMNGARTPINFAGTPMGGSPMAVDARPGIAEEERAAERAGGGGAVRYARRSLPADSLRAEARPPGSQGANKAPQVSAAHGLGWYGWEARELASKVLALPPRPATVMGVVHAQTLDDDIIGASQWVSKPERRSVTPFSNRNVTFLKSVPNRHAGRSKLRISSPPKTGLRKSLESGIVTF